MKKRIRHRDSELTKRKLLDAVSQLMREKGFTSLKTNTIARMIGKDKNLIRYHFQGLAGLEKTYIREKDYWGVFFERFKLSDGADALEVEQLFVELMKENLRFFHGDREMQRIILWQISEENPVLRSISDSREEDGAKLLNMTDPYFSGTEVNFRALIALLLGGSYYMVLHANTNKSVVCGINVNSERDRSDVLRSIEQVISWAFKSVEQRSDFAKAETTGQPYRFAGLESMAGLLRKYYLEGRLCEFSVPAFKAELRIVEGGLLAEMELLREEREIRTFIRLNLFRLGRIADSCYLAKERANPAPGLLTQVIWNVIGPFWEHVPSGFVLPMVIWADALEGLNERMQVIKETLVAAGIKERLACISLLPFESFRSAKGRSTWGELFYLQRYTGHLEIAVRDPVCTLAELKNVLLSLNLNDGRLIDYCLDQMTGEAVAVVPSDRMEILLGAKKGAEDLHRLFREKFEPQNPDAIAMLVGRLDSELSFLAEKEQRAVNQKKLPTHLTVQQLALWQKLQYDGGIYVQGSIGDFSAQVSNNFTSKSGDALSASSIRAKLYTTDPAVTAPLEKILLDMLAQLRGPGK